MKNKFIVNNVENIVELELYHKKLGKVYSILDIDDLDKILSFNTTWFVSISKNSHIDGVKTKVQRNKKRKSIWLHRLITNCPIDRVVDHKNGNTLDNRKVNLRIVKSKENSTNRNSLSHNKSGHTNIYVENNKFRVRINYKSFGSYKTLEEAIDVRNKHIKDIFPLRER